MISEEVILVDENDRQTGTMEKIEAHRKGFLHRAFSVFILNSNGQMLLQRRAAGKYHSPGLWTNTCCSHPRPGESINDAAVRRLKQEMGMECTLEETFSFIYRAKLDNGLTEHEFDHVLFGISDVKPLPDPEEADRYEYADMDFLSEDMVNNPDNYTIWFRIAYPRIRDKITKLANKF